MSLSFNWFFPAENRTANNNGGNIPDWLLILLIAIAMTLIMKMK